MIRLRRPLIIQADGRARTAIIHPLKPPLTDPSLTPFLTQHKAARVPFRFHYQGSFPLVSAGPVCAGREGAGVCAVPRARDAAETLSAACPKDMNEIY